VLQQLGADLSEGLQPSEDTWVVSRCYRGWAHSKQSSNERRDIKEETIKGWGFPRYIVSKLGPMAGTLMAIDPRAPKVARFIKLGGDPYLIRYNSRLPIVVYVPEGVEVRYRIWTAGEEAKAIEKG